MDSGSGGSQRHDRRSIERVIDGRSSELTDALAVEEPLELRAHGRGLATIMRTPGHDVELIVGLLSAEGVLRTPDEYPLVRAADAQTLGPLEQGNVVEVDLAEKLLTDRWEGRHLISSAACGVCGAAALAILDDLATPSRSQLTMSSELILELPGRLRAQQALFESTGGLHGAALVDAGGAVLVCREDIGRHNAVDKVVGWSLLHGVDFEDYALVVSGRAGYEIVHKAIAAGIPIVAAVSAASSLAVDLAERWRTTLVGFVREKSFNIYSHGTRILREDAAKIPAAD